MASSSLKSTRKTYSFEEREILITLINKYEDIEEKKSDPVSMCKRKSAWSQLADEYNSLVGPQSVRSAVQLRRCWENMKACKRNREEKKLRTISKSFCQLSKDHARSKCWESRTPLSEVAIPTGTVGLPPNVVFEPKESEPFTLQSVCPLKPSKQNSSEENNCKDSESIYNKVNSNPSSHGSMIDGYEKSTKRIDTPVVERMDKENTPERSRLIFKSNATQTFMSPSMIHEQPRKVRRSLHREEELHVLALSEAQMKVDIAAMLKEEARIKLEEAHYRKEEARLRMLLFTYKLDRIKED
ncbi:PREDICTED: myb/SANT-like DNA-binding domain-containing protein 3 [Dufourea novaeangliae]|uniref:Regulatory protein zeste n=1 Tax=Dufourea novaeangliae TaxID=178035 RepID=A0A154PR68_DUFNO|nr:PREDICTED: myb/SANT-like DNA-binding domain-containing protein 3 [Dufourea novaeangliae]KZC13610.1 Myb/SANT-like DNA-binding domain-containing protein 3 [Dufourea novaeangliae]